MPRPACCITLHRQPAYDPVPQISDPAAAYLVVQVLVILGRHAGHQVVPQHVQLLVQRVHHLLSQLVMVEPACRRGNGQTMTLKAAKLTFLHDMPYMGARCNIFAQIYKARHSLDNWLPSRNILLRVSIRLEHSAFCPSGPMTPLSFCAETL